MKGQTAEDCKEELREMLNQLVEKLSFPESVIDLRSDFHKNDDTLYFNHRSYPLKICPKEGASFSKFEQYMLTNILPHFVFLDTKIGYTVNTSSALDTTIYQAFDNMKTFWLEVNEKTSWTRTKLSKKTNYYMRNMAVKIWIDVIEHEALVATSQNKKLREFLAKEFEKLGVRNG